MLKIISWNCNGALRKKFDHISMLDADICVIQECENPDLTSCFEYKKWASNYLWIGDNKHKGIGVFAKDHIVLDKLNWPNSYQGNSVKHFLPCLVNGKIQLIGVWAHRNNSSKFGYIGQVWRYLQINKSKMTNVIIAGDFNSNARWDLPNRWWNHSDVVRELADENIVSLYHEFFDERQGLEAKETFLLQKNINKLYHIDYIFAKKHLVDDRYPFKVGERDEWLKYSDHMPIVGYIRLS